MIYIHAYIYIYIHTYYARLYMVILFVQISTGSLYIHLSDREHTCITWHYSPFHSVITLHYIHTQYTLGYHRLLGWSKARARGGPMWCCNWFLFCLAAFVVSACLCQHFNFLRRIKSPCTISYPGFRALGSKRRGLSFFLVGKHELIPNFGVGICDNIWVQQQDKALPLKFYSSLANAGYANMDHGRGCCLYFPGKTMETKLRQIPEFSLPRMAKY